MFLTCNELSAKLVPGRIENIVQLDLHNIAFQVRTSREAYVWLHLCWHYQAARISLGIPPPIQESSPYSFASTLRHLLKGFSIVNISFPNSFERIIEITLSERLLDPPKWIIKIEVMGARSNVILLSANDNAIQACAYQVSSSKSVRPLQTGIIYQNPPIGGGIFTPQQSFESYSQFYSRLMSNPKISLMKAMVSCYRGMSPNIVRSICRTTNINSETPVEDISEEKIRIILDCYNSWKGPIIIYFLNYSL